MKQSLTYLTRRCPRKCEYCALRDAVGLGPELTTAQWAFAFDILKDLGITFNLILGNETWLLGEALLTILRDNKVPYALYTTAPEPLFSRHKRQFFDSGIIDNLSCGIDYPVNEGLEIEDDSYLKSKTAWDAFSWVRQHYPHLDTQGTITIHRQNFRYLPKLVQELSELGVFVGANMIHWNRDGKFDFFPKREEIEHLLFTEEDIPELQEVFKTVAKQRSLLQNPEYFLEDVRPLVNMEWHCKGDPYGGPTIDSDGTLRVCGYRRGTRTSKFTIFDLPKKWDEWKEAVEQDAAECPGCSWVYPWMYRYWVNTDPKMGKKVFTAHAGTRIDQSKWSKRKIN